MRDMDAIERAFSILGGTRAVADHFKVSYEAARKWKRAVPADRVLDIARACNWQVTPHQLNPRYYPNPSDALPSSYAFAASFSLLQLDSPE